MRVAGIVILFLVSVRFKKSKSIVEVIPTRYDDNIFIYIYIYIHIYEISKLQSNSKHTAK